jgi:hypothetical protein
LGTLSIPPTVNTLGNGAFRNCSNINQLVLTSRASQPNWLGTDIFQGWDETSTDCTVVITGGWNTNDALVYLQTKGLPTNWDVA